MTWLKEFSGKQIYDLDDQEVLEFVIFKDVNDSGRTIVHHSACPNIGVTNINDCRDNIRCSTRHASDQ